MIHTHLSCFLIVIGAIVMLLSILRFKNFFSFVESVSEAKRKSIRNLLKVHIMLMILFLVGYIVVALAFCMKLRIVSEVFVGVIFMFGSFFVLLNVIVQEKLNKERKKDEETIRNLARFPEENPSPVLRIDRNRRVLYANSAGKQLLKETGSEENLIPKSWDEEYEFSKLEFIKNVEINCNERIYSIVVVPVKNEGYINLYCRDITERKQAVEEIKRNQDTTNVLNYLLNQQLKNVPVENILGQALDQILNIPWISLESIGAIFLVENNPNKLVLKVQRGLSLPIQKACSEVDFGKCLCGKAALSGKLVFSGCIDERHDVKYAGIVDHGHYCVPIISANKVLGVINTYTKAGHKRNVKEEDFLNAVANILAGIIERLTIEKEKESLQSSLTQSQKMEAIGTLAGGIAHDFNNLLTIIMGSASLALNEADKESTIYKDLKEIGLAGSRAAALTKQLLLYSRKQPMGFIQVNINNTINNLLKMLKRLIGEDIILKSDFAPDIWTVNADESTIEQVITNLCVNAKDAMLKGGKIILKTENIVLDSEQIKIIDESQTGAYVRISVEDNGSGMDRETIKRIFEPFFSTKGIGKGTGLGLSVVYGIIKAHKGWINVYSELSHGTVFKIYLPAVKLGIITKTEETIPIENLKGNSEGILIIEDDEGVLEYTKMLLTRNVYSVYEAKNAEEAVEVFKANSNKIELALIDMVLPDKNGLELIADLKSIKNNLKAIFLSAYLEDKSKSSEIKDGGYKFIQKPFAVHDLLNAVREVLTSSNG